jgi:hypothetical protein
MRHAKTLRVRVLYAGFIGLSASWALVVINTTPQWAFWQAMGLAALGAAMIAALGLRIVTVLDTRWFIQDCNKRAKSQAVSGNDPLVPCQVGYRQPYFDARIN